MTDETVKFSEVTESEAEQKEMINYETNLITPHGLGFGEGAISVESRLESITDPLSLGMMSQAEGIIQKHILVPIEIDDDGCGDGRSVSKIFSQDKVFNKSLNRAKVFGGGATMAMAAKLGTGDFDNGLADLFVESIHELEQTGLNFGAHSADHAPGDSCGCGAIDLAPKIIKNAVSMQGNISTAASALLGSRSNIEPILDQVMFRFADYCEKNAHPDEYSGQEILDKIEQRGKVVKELSGEHKEVAIALNEVAGHTIDQALIRQATDNEAQVFAVDLWRLEELAQRLYPDDGTKQSEAYVSMIVYSLAVAGTLTDGSLPVYVISPEPAFITKEVFSQAG